MKYKGNALNLPQDIRPLGINNLNQLVHHHLGSNSFDVVAHVQANLCWLKQLHDRLGVVSALSNQSDNLDLIGRHSKEIFALAQSLPALQEIYCHLDDLVEDMPRLNELYAKTKENNHLLRLLLGQVSKDGINHLLEEFSKLEKNLSKYKDIEQVINDLITANHKVERTLIKLNASDAVLKYLDEKTEENKRKALDAIEESESIGNNESLNRQRLEK